MAKKYLAGLERAQRVFRSMPAKAQQSLVRGMNRSVAEMAARVVVLAPERSGALRDSVGTNLAATTTRLRARVFVSAFYARFVEFGTVDTAARPFFWPAVRGLRKKAVARVKNALRRGAREIARGPR